MKKLVAFIIICAPILLSSCEKVWLPEEEPDALSVYVNKDLKQRILIGSSTPAEFITNPSTGSYHECRLYDEKDSAPDWVETPPIAAIMGFKHAGVDYDGRLGLAISTIQVYGLDESLGFGNILDVHLNRGKYDGRNELVKDVQIKSYKMATYNKNTGAYNEDADIHIVFTMKTGALISIRYTGGVVSSGLNKYFV